MRFDQIRALGALALALAPACVKDEGRAGTTVITSGTAPSGVRVTNVALERDPAERLAGELCMHDATCNRIAPSHSDEARLLAEQACVTERLPHARALVGGWWCSAGPARDAFDACLAAIRSEGCESRLDDPRRLEACEPRTICPEEEVPSSR